jgi:hypothetical protein
MSYEDVESAHITAAKYRPAVGGQLRGAVFGLNRGVSTKKVRHLIAKEKSDAGRSSVVGTD